MEAISVLVGEQETVHQIINAGDENGNLIFLHVIPDAIYVVSDPLASCRVIKKLPIDKQPLVTVLPFGNHLVTLHKNGLIRLWQVSPDIAMIGERSVKGSITSAAVASERTFLVCTNDGKVHQVIVEAAEERKRGSASKFLSKILSSKSSRTSHQLAKGWSSKLTTLRTETIQDGVVVGREVIKNSSICQIVADATKFVAFTAGELHFGSSVNGSIFTWDTFSRSQQKNLYGMFRDIIVCINGDYEKECATNDPGRDSIQNLNRFQTSGLEIRTKTRTIVQYPKREYSERRAISSYQVGSHLFTITPFGGDIILIQRGTSIHKLDVPPDATAIGYHRGHFAIGALGSVAFTKLPDDIQKLIVQA